MQKYFDFVSVTNAVANCVTPSNIQTAAVCYRVPLNFICIQPLKRLQRSFKTLFLKTTSIKKENRLKVTLLLVNAAFVNNNLFLIVCLNKQIKVKKRPIL